MALVLAVAAVAGVTAGQAPLGARTAQTAPPEGPGGLAFYTPPSTPPSGAHGDLVSYRPTTVNLGPDAPAVNAWNVMYQSTDAADRPVYVTGTVLVPTAPANGTRQVISYAFGTHGLAQRCAPSLQLGAGTDYETANLVAALEKGYAVVATDYAGYTTGSAPSYIVGAAEGHAVLDIVKAASQVPGSGVSATAPTAIWGYSQGGQAAAWAAELQPSYMPNLPLEAVAAGGVPADLEATARNLDGGAGATFELMAILGLSAQYPEQLPIDAILTPEGRQAFDTLKTQCVFESLPALLNRSLSDFTTGGLGLDQLLALEPVATAIEAQKVGESPIEAPLYMYHGQADQFVPLGQAYAAKQSYCELGVETTFDLYPSEHITTQFQGAGPALAFIADRFAGTPAPGNCDQSTPPDSTAPPKGGDFAVTLDEWNLAGTLNLATLGQQVTLPGAGRFSAEANLSTEALTGDLTVPDFDAPISFIGLPLTARVGIEPAGTTGTVSLGTDGQLHVQGTAKATIVVRQLSLFGLIPLTFSQCRTSAPVEFALSFDGPVSALGAGGLSFAGTTAIPGIVGCEADFIGLFVGPLLTGPNNAFTFTVAPPAPTRA